MSEDRYTYVELELDSYDALNSYSSSYLKSDWPMFEVTTPLENLVAMKVLEVQVPFTFYVINERNNTFLLTDDNVTNAEVILEKGNYNAETLSDEFQSALIAASGVANSYDVSFTGPEAKPQRDQFHIVKTNGATFSLIFGTATDEGYSNPRRALGFNAGVNTAVPGGVLVSPNVVQITGPNYMYLNSRTFGTILSCTLPKSTATNLGGAVGPQITKFSVNTQPGGVIFWQDPAPLYKFNVELPTLSTFDLYLTLGNDASTNVVKLNGASFSIKLGILKRESLTKELVAAEGSYPDKTQIGAKRRR